MNRSTCLAILVTLASLPFPAAAEEKPRFVLRPEGKLQWQYESNAVRAPGGRADTIFKTFAGFTASYRLSAATTLTGFYQAQVWRFGDQPQHNTWLNVATLVVSHRFATPWFHGIDPFLAAQLINQNPTAAGRSGSNDWNILTGFNIVEPLGETALLLGGYQFDRLQAEVPQSRYSAHSLKFTYRQVLSAQLACAASYQLQWRLPLDRSTEDLLRNALSIGMDYLPLAWLRLGFSASYVNDSLVSNRSNRGNGGTDYVVIGLNAGSNLLFGW